MGVSQLELVEARANRGAKDSVFCDLFSDKRYLLRLYRDLHPEDTAAKEDNLDLVTIDRVLTRGQYNDLGFIARGRFVILVEAQSTWSPNIVVRMLLYLADTYRRSLAAVKGNVYDVAPLNLPVPELYVVYTGLEKDVPEMISFANDIVKDADSSVEVLVKVLRGQLGGGSAGWSKRTQQAGEVDAPGILDEYVAFAHSFDEKRQELGYTLAAVEATSAS